MDALGNMQHNLAQTIDLNHPSFDRDKNKLE